MSFFKSIQGQDCLFVIAEIGANHNGDIQIAKATIDAAISAGCSAVKFQSWSKESIFSRTVYRQNEHLSDSRFRTQNLEEMVKLFSLKHHEHVELKKYCDQKGITFCSSVFSAEEADLLEKLQVPFIKIPSMDVPNLRLLSYVAKKKIPILLSTGMSTLGEIETAYRAIESEGNTDIGLMHCVALYPPPDESVNLNNLEMLRTAFQCPVGFSDHTLGVTLTLAAIAKGARIIEKHFTLDKNMPGWDHAISADPSEMKTIVVEGNRIIKAMGSYERRVSPAELEQRKAFRRSLVAKRAIQAGEKLSWEMLDFKRPGYGISPSEAFGVIGRVAKVAIQADDLIAWDNLNE